MKDSGKTLYLIVGLIILLFGFLSSLLVVQNSNHKEILEKANYNNELITLLSQTQEQLIIQNEILLLELSKLDSILLLENLSKQQIYELKQQETYRNKKLSTNLEGINRQLVKTDTTSRQQYTELQTELSYNRKRLIKSSEPKLVIEDISGKVIGDDNNWTVKYSFKLKNYGGDIAKLKLVPLNDSVPTIKFPLPFTGKLPHMGAISVTQSSKTLYEDYHESYLQMEDSFGNPFKQKISFTQNELGFRFDLGFIEKNSN